MTISTVQLWGLRFAPVVFLLVFTPETAPAAPKARKTPRASSGSTARVSGPDRQKNRTSASSQAPAPASTATLTQGPQPLPHTGGWRFRFTQDQIRRLRWAGCRFDLVDRQIANRLWARGFTAHDFVQAYVTLAYLRPGKRGQLENLVVFRYLGFQTRDFHAFLAYGGTLTQYYNSRIGGVGQRIAGWVLVGIGAAGVLSGAVTILVGKTTADESDIRGAKKAVYVLGGVLLGTGGLLTVIGIPLIVKGTAKTNRWVPSSVLEQGHRRKLDRYRLHTGQAYRPAAGNRLRPPHPVGFNEAGLRLHPFVHTTGGGVGLSLTW